MEPALNPMDQGAPKTAQSDTDTLGYVIEAMSDGLAVFDDQARLILFNARFKKMNPVIADLIVPETDWEILVRESGRRGIIPPEVCNRLMWMEARLAEGDDKVPALNVEVPGGLVNEIRMRPTPVNGFVVIQRDITEQVRSIETDRQADMLLRKVLEACPTNLMMCRVGDGQILYRSPSATELFGTTMFSADLFASAEQRADFITALLPDGRVEDMHLLFRRGDGTAFPASVSARLIDYHGEDVIVSSTIDLTSEIAMQKTLAEQREQLFQSEKMSALGELLAGVAHELNNPLSLVVGHALMLKEEVTDPNFARRVEKIGAAAERCAGIVKTFLAMARQQPVRLVPVSLRDITEAAIDSLRQGSRRAAVEIVVDLPDDLPMVESDRDQMTQVVINLLTNAEQAITGAGKGDRITVSASLDAPSETVLLQIADNGPGVPKDIRSRIFDPMFTTKDIGEGTGIGLAFVHRVVTAHGGRINLEPDRGEGAVFSIHLPIVKTRATAPDTADADLAPVPHSRILVVDDDLDVADLIKEILVRDGFRVDHAGSAEAALPLMRNHRYALILSDLNMPGLGGKAFFDLIGRDMPEVSDRVGFVSGDTMSPAARGFLEKAGRPFLEKPISPIELRKLVRSMLGTDEGQAVR